MDDWDALGHGMKIDRRSTEWGMTSMWIGGCFLIMAPIMLIFNDFYWSIGIKHAAPDELDHARIVAPIVAGAFLSLIAFGIFAGFRGLSLARATNQPAALALGGTLCGIVAFIVWVGLSLNLMGIIGMFQ